MKYLLDTNDIPIMAIRDSILPFSAVIHRQCQRINPSGEVLWYSEFCLLHRLGLCFWGGGGGGGGGVAIFRGIGLLQVFLGVTLITDYYYYYFFFIIICTCTTKFSVFLGAL